MIRRSGLVCAVSLLLYSAMFGRPVHAQAPAAPAKPTTAAQPESQSPGLGFSMESEMLTYSAMDRNSQGIGCDIAFYVYGEEARKGVAFNPPPPNLPSSGSVTVDELCKNAKKWADAAEQPQNSINNDGVVILQSGSGVQSGLELWRTYMAEMESLRSAAAEQGCPDSSAQHTSFGTTYSPHLRLVSLEPSARFELVAQTEESKPPATATTARMNNVEGAANLAEQVVSADENAEEVRGTVESQTFVNTIAGELRVLGIPVLVPETSMPHAMSPHTRYVVLDEAQKLEDLRPCLMKKTADAGNDKTASASPWTPSILNDIDSFLASAFGWSGIAGPGGKNPNPMGFGVSQDLRNLLSSDLLAQELRIGAPAGTEQYQWRHILWVRALESGGSVMRRERFWGSKIRYSGGSIVTYALVMMEGPLECSGAFSDYGGPLSAKEFKEKGTPTLAAEISVAGGCRALVQRQSLSGPHH